MSIGPKLIIITSEPPQYWLSFQHDEPYLSGIYQSDYFGPFASEEEALQSLIENGGYSGDLMGIQRLERDPAQEGFWETVSCEYEVSFSLPIDELTEHFSPGLNQNNELCPLADSLTYDVEVNVQTNESRVRILDTQKRGSLECLALVRNPAGRTEPHAMMTLTVFLTFQKPKTSALENLIEREATVTAAIPPYYPDPIAANIQHWTLLT